jgi:hypothetical protein
MLAALTGAVAASRLGIAGTIIGTAFMSLASTVGASFYKHYITSSNKRLREAAATLAPRASQTAVATAVARHHAAERGQAGLAQTRVDQTRIDQTRVDQTRPGRASLDQTELELTRPYPERELGAPPAPPTGYVSPDAAETQVIPPLHMNGDLAATRTQIVERDQAGPAGGQPPGQGDDTEAAEQPGPAGHGGDWTWPWSRRRWLVVAATALGVFVVAMAAVTVFEAAVGKPLDAVVWHQHNSGTTLGGLVGGSGGSGHHHPRPSTSPSHSTTTSHSPRPSHSPSSSPSPTTSSPTPTPSGSPTPSSSTTPTTGASSPAPSRSAPAQTALPGAQ